MPPVWDGKAYAAYRPSYPESLYDTILEFAGGDAAHARSLAVDVGCGSGQVTCSLAARFENVVGIDESESQLANAATAPNIEYRRGTAEATGLPAGCADLITAAAALHWFDVRRFYAEARRVLRPGGTLAAWCYNELPDFDGNAKALGVYLAMRQHFWPWFNPRLQDITTNGYSALEPLATEFSTVERRRVEMTWHVSPASLAGWVRSWSPFHAFAEERGREEADAVVQRFEADMTAALGWESRDASVAATLPLDLILAKNPLPL